MANEKYPKIPRFLLRDEFITKYDKFGWKIEADEHILGYAIALAHIWMERE